MTVVECYVGGKKLNQVDDNRELPEVVSSLLYEGIAQNTQGNVYVPRVGC